MPRTFFVTQDFWRAWVAVRVPIGKTASFSDEKGEYLLKVNGKEPRDSIEIGEAHEAKAGG
jgi:hypothetical protein